MLGQTGAVTPALQAIAAALSVEHGLLPPTINVDALDPRCPLDLVGSDGPRRLAVDYVLANATGFGGFYYSAFVVGRAEAKEGSPPRP
jgi:3-oxoacyl-(acyl-carrier-protein) synthase